jgi:hypothetical protein
LKEEKRRRRMEGPGWAEWRRWVTTATATALLNYETKNTAKLNLILLIQ